MSKRVLTMGALAAILVSAVIVNLSLLDVITVDQLRNSLGKSLMVVAVSTLTIVLLVAITRIGRPQAPEERTNR